MSTYADAAQQGAEKLEKEKERKQNLKAAENKAKEAAYDITKGAKQLKENTKKESSKITKELKKEYEQNKGPVIDFFYKIVADVQAAAAYIVKVTKNSAVTAQEELKNPVVVSHAVLGIGAIAAMTSGAVKSHKIFGGKTDLEITAILAGLAGLMAADVYMFGQMYPKYDKKSLK